MKNGLKKVRKISQKIKEEIVNKENFIIKQQFKKEKYFYIQ
jgi:hypothetical protein